MVYENLEEKRKEMKDKWDRILPTNELLYDRWEKARAMNAGEGSSVYDSTIVLGDVRLGENVWVGPWVLLDGSGGLLEIGAHTNISAGVQIYTHDTVRNALSGGLCKKKNGAVRIEDRCYIAPMSLISAGVTIGRCSVVGANSLVTKSFPDHSIIAGTPAKKIGEVIEHIDGNIELEYFSV